MTSGSDAVGGGLFLLVLTCLCMVVIIGLHLAVSYWIYQDARKRGNPNAVVWAVLNLVSDPLGLLLYALIGRNQTLPPGGPSAPDPGAPPAPPPSPESTTRL